MLEALRAAIEESVTGDQASDQVIRLLDRLRNGEAGASGLMAGLNLTHRPTFRKNYLDPALAADLIERTQPASPRSPTQRYRLTEKGRALLAGRSRKKG